jgi:hypothetical protein
MKELILNPIDNKFEAVINLKSEKVMLQIEGATSLTLYASVDGETWIEHTSNIDIVDTDIINIVNAKFMMYLKIESSNNVTIKILD